MGWKCPNCEAIVADHLRICSNCNWSPHVRRFARNMMERIIIKFSSASEETPNLAKSSDEQARVIKAHHCEM